MASKFNSLECNVQRTADRYICTTQIDNFATTSKETELGTSITTDVFAMHFPDSFGDASWVMQIYPNGQYAEGHSNGHLSAYLKLIAVEKENTSLTVNIEFKVVGIHGFQRRRSMDTTLKAVKHCFNWSSKLARWYGGRLVRLEDLRGFSAVQIECHLKEKQMERIPEKLTTKKRNSTDATHFQNTPTPDLKESTFLVPEVESSIKGLMNKSPDEENATKCIPESQSPNFSFRSSDIRYRNNPTQNLLETTNKVETKAPMGTHLKKDTAVCRNVKEFVTQFEENIQRNVTENEQEAEVPKTKTAENCLKDRSTRASRESDDVSVDLHQPLQQSEVPVKKNVVQSVIRFVANLFGAIFGQLFTK